MPKITSEQSFDGAEALIDRLGLDELLAEVREIVTAFELLIEERKDANGTAGLRAIIDNRFRAAGGWSQRKGPERRYVRRSHPSTEGASARHDRPGGTCGSQ